MRKRPPVSIVQNSSMTVAEIAYRTGFNDPSYFTRVFSKEFGELPGDLRKWLAFKVLPFLFSHFARIVLSFDQIVIALWRGRATPLQGEVRDGISMLRQRIMSIDFSWENAVQQYFSVYQHIGGRIQVVKQQPEPVKAVAKAAATPAPKTKPNTTRKKQWHSDTISWTVEKVEMLRASCKIKALQFFCFHTTLRWLSIHTFRTDRHSKFRCHKQKHPRFTWNNWLTAFNTPSRSLFC